MAWKWNKKCRQISPDINSKNLKKFDLFSPIDFDFSQFLKWLLAINKRTVRTIAFRWIEPNWSVQTVRTVAICWNFEVCIDGRFELGSGSRREHTGAGACRANCRWYWSRRAFKHLFFACLWMNPSSCAKLPFEKSRTQKHVFHVVYIRHIPLWEVAIERSRTKKHATHVFRPRHIPLWEVAVEEFSTRKHATHVGDMWHVPRPNRPVRTLETLAFWWQFETCVNGSLELYSRSRRER